MRQSRVWFQSGLMALVIAMAGCSAPVEAEPSLPEDAEAWLADRGLPVALPENVGMSSARLRQIDALMQQHIDDGDIQGSVTAVARKGKVVHFAAHGLMDVESERPMALDAMFRMASDPLHEISAVLMVQQPTKGLAKDFEDAIRNAILE